MPQSITDTVNQMGKRKGTLQGWCSLTGRNVSWTGVAVRDGGVSRHF